MYRPKDAQQQHDEDQEESRVKLTLSKQQLRDLIDSNKKLGLGIEAFGANLSRSLSC